MLHLQFILKILTNLLLHKMVALVSMIFNLVITVHLDLMVVDILKVIQYSIVMFILMVILTRKIVLLNNSVTETI